MYHSIQLISYNYFYHSPMSYKIQTRGKIRAYESEHTYWTQRCSEAGNEREQYAELIFHVILQVQSYQKISTLFLPHSSSQVSLQVCKISNPIENNTDVFKKMCIFTLLLYNFRKVVWFGEVIVPFHWRFWQSLIFGDFFYCGK